MNSTILGRSCLGLALALAFIPTAVGAEEPATFTGYTRPGAPMGSAGVVEKAGKKSDEPSLGATVYFKVFDQNADGGEGWGTNFKNLEPYFVSGQASLGRTFDKLDTSARYLYLYQVVNDSQREAQIKSVSIRLLVPPHLITSWGHFADKRGGEASKRAGFAMAFDDAKAKNPKERSGILPLSSEHFGVSDPLYRNPAPYFHAPKPYTLADILLNNKPAGVGNGANVGRAPERVVLQTMDNFEGAPNWLEKDRVRMPGLSPMTRPTLSQSNLTNPYFSPLSPLTPGAGSMTSSLGASSPSQMTASLRRAPAVAAYWTDAPLRPGKAGGPAGQRSTLFGFTSNFPPVYEDVRVRGNVAPEAKGPAAAAPDSGASTARADGQVPTPVAIEQPVQPHSPIGSFGGPVGGIGAGGGLLRGGSGMGMSGGGFGFPLGGGGIGGGGGGIGGGGMSGLGGGSGNSSGSGSGSGNSNGTSSNSQPQPQVILLPQQGALGQPVNVSQSQTQSLSQSQSQSQNQSQDPSSSPPGDPSGPHGAGGHSPHGHVVPEPAAVVSALLGLPVLLLLVWRRRPASAASA